MGLIAALHPWELKKSFQHSIQVSAFAFSKLKLHKRVLHSLVQPTFRNFTGFGL